jgi:hypothetical protein
MVSFLDALGQTANFLNNDPSFQREEMYYRGIDPRIVEPQIERMVAGQQERQAAEAEMQRKQSLAQQIMERGAELSPQEIMAIGAQDAELGKLAAKVFLDGQQMTAQQQKAQALMAQGYDEKTANDISLGLIKNAVDENGRPIRINNADGSILPVGGGNAEAQPNYQPYGDETVVSGNDYEDINTLFDETQPQSSNLPITAEEVLRNQGITNPTPIQKKVAISEAASNRAALELNTEKTNFLEKAKSNAQLQGAQYNTITQTIDKAIASIDNEKWYSPQTGFTGNIASYIGGTDANNLSNTLATVKASLGFDKLQNIRDNSPTGGALGSVAVKELEFLQKVVASLEQSQDNKQLKENLFTVKNAYQSSQKRLKNAYIKDFGSAKGFDDYFYNVGQGEDITQTEQSSSLPKVGTVEGGYVFQGGDPANPDNWSKQ